MTRAKLAEPISVVGHCAKLRWTSGMTQYTKHDAVPTGDSTAI